MVVLVNPCVAGTTSNAILNGNNITFILPMYFSFLLLILLFIGYTYIVEFKVQSATSDKLRATSDELV